MINSASQYSFGKIIKMLLHSVLFLSMTSYDSLEENRKMDVFKIAFSYFSWENKKCKGPFMT